MRFVDDEDLVAAFHRRVGDGFAQAAGVVDAAVGRTVDFHHVHVVALGDAAALLALVAGLGGGCVFAVEGLGEDARDGGLAHAARAAEQIGGRDLILGGGAGEDGLDGLLSRDFGEGLRTVAGGERCVTHVFPPEKVRGRGEVSLPRRI